MKSRLFEDLVVSRPGQRRRGLAVPVSIAIHAGLVSAAVIIPLFLPDSMQMPAPEHPAWNPLVPIVVAAAPLPPPPPRGNPSRASVDSRPRPPRPVAPVQPQQALTPIDDAAVSASTNGESESEPCLGCSRSGPDGDPKGVIDGVGPTIESALPQLIHVGHGYGVAAPRKIHDAPLVYPEPARRIGLHGEVVIECQIDTSGRVVDAHVLAGPPLLREAALETVQQWRYTPTLLNGIPVSVIMTVKVMYNLH
jgi:protein TonB